MVVAEVGIPDPAGTTAYSHCVSVPPAFQLNEAPEEVTFETAKLSGAGQETRKSKPIWGLL